MSDESLHAAITARGGPRAIAAELGISRQAVEQWQEAPARRVIQLERLLGIPRSKLRPDLYPPDSPPHRPAVRNEARP
ncbi:Cro/CI family transcriptional regulator [Methylobacterium fujisawaense]|uniref:transcriptional regulator n=1 Tax=Methylobacterium fujisawaense TaxID=107400 RepID=UPI0031F5629F